MSNNINDIINAKNRVMDYMKKHNLAGFEVDFSGYGDSGNFDTPMFYETKNEDGSMSDLHDLDNHNPSGGIADDATALADYFVTKQGLDWYNDGGGQGHVTVYADGNVRIHTEINITSVETHDDEQDLDTSLAMDKLRGGGQSVREAAIAELSLAMDKLKGGGQ